MITIEQLSKEVLIDSLYSTTCLACGERKRAEQTFCFRCYGTLPRPMGIALYHRVGKGYEPAVLRALNFLQVEKIHLPEGK